MSTPCLWTARVWQEFHADNLTRAYRDVLLTLRTYRGHGRPARAIPRHARRSRRLLAPDRPARPTASPAAWPGILGGTPRAGRLALAAQLEQLQARRAGRGGATRFAARLATSRHYRTIRRRRGESRIKKSGFGGFHAGGGPASGPPRAAAARDRSKIAQWVAWMRRGSE